MKPTALGHPRLRQQVLASQRRRRLVAEALAIGTLKSWDHQPLVDASQQYMRNHIDLDDLERKARYPQPAPWIEKRGRHAQVLRRRVRPGPEPGHGPRRRQRRAMQHREMADPGWSDIASTNAVARLLLESLGYQVKIDSLAVPIIYGGLKDGRVDAFLGNWMPAQQGFHDKFIANGDVQQLAKNLEGTEFTLAVPDYVWNAG
jgi:hypothetical protein